MSRQCRPCHSVPFEVGERVTDQGEKALVLQGLFCLPREEVSRTQSTTPSAEQPPGNGKGERKSPSPTAGDRSISVGFVYKSVLGNLSQFASLQMM